ncbi:FIST signal transduction protein [Methylibium sp.]|uniref:FIST signal transduction protein n=1 Tax=Methylibium sp. TaxID=2067992 RepID=UPI003D0B6941
MQAFVHAHATHPDARLALGLVCAQLDAQLAGRPAPTLGWCYLTDHHATAAEALLAALRERYPGADWVGTVGIGICASGVEYFDEPGLAVMLAPLPRAHFRVFSGRRPLQGDAGFTPHTALVHADPSTPELAELIGELSERVDSGYLFGGLGSARNRTLTIAADTGDGGVFTGGLSGVAFTADVAIVSRITQGCQPVGPVRAITRIERNVVYELDDQPALDCLLSDLGADEHTPREALPRLRSTLVGLSDTAVQHGEFVTAPRRHAFGTETRVRHLIGIDPQRRGIAIADTAAAGQQLAFCRRDTEAARRDLVRIATEIRSTLEPEELSLAAQPAALALRADGSANAVAAGGRQIVGALYMSCTGRGGPHFGAPSAELQLLRHALGDVPLVGFFAAGEIGHRHLYGYTGVLTVFTAAA